MLDLALRALVQTKQFLDEHDLLPVKPTGAELVDKLIVIPGEFERLRGKRPDGRPNPLESYITYYESHYQDLFDTLLQKN